MALVITPTEFKLFAPEFAAETDDRVLMFLDSADMYYCEGTWGKRARLAKMLITAHLLSGSTTAGYAGVVTSESVGPLSRSYSAKGGGDSEWANTHYGRQFTELKRLVIRTPMVL